MFGVNLPISKFNSAGGTSSKAIEHGRYYGDPFRPPYTLNWKKFTENSF